MAHQAFLPVLVAVLMWLVPGARSQAAQSSEKLLPLTTKGYLSIPDVDKLRQQFDLTQLGQLANHPLMKDFAEDLRQQVKNRFDKSGVRLSLKLEDLEGVYGGEVCFALVQPNNDEKQHATVLLMDVTGKSKEAAALLQKVAKNMAAKGATQAVETVKGVPITSYTLPKRRGEKVAARAFFFVHQDWLVAADHEATIREILGRFSGQAADHLASLPAFKAIMARCTAGAVVTPPQVRWFLEPFGYTKASRAAAGGRRKRGTDMAKVLAKQGFTAVQGMGGHVSFAVSEMEVLHKSFIYAPAVNKAGHKYNLAMRMMDFPMTANLLPQDWAMRDVASYLTFNWKMREAFEFLQSLVDEFAGAPIFEDVIASLEKDPNGPKIKVRDGFLNHLGQRVTFMTNHRLPVTPTCERWLFAVEVTNPAIVAKTLDKVMGADPAAVKRLIGKQVVWEIVEPAPEPGEKRKVKRPGLDSSRSRDEDEEEGDEINPMFRHAALTVVPESAVHGHLMVASHIDFMEELLKRVGQEPSLGTTPEYLLVQAALTKIGAGNNSFRFFIRTERAYQPTYELLRQGKMPEAETLFASLVNRWLAPDEEGVTREQQIDGTKLPDFDKVRNYFGPAGWYVNSEATGWYITGCLLKKPAPAAAPEPPATKPATTDPTAKPEPSATKPKPAATDPAAKPEPPATKPAAPKPAPSAPKP